MGRFWYSEIGLLLPPVLPRVHFAEKMLERIATKSLERLATPAGFEPATLSLEG
jgi:hypothetical protein